MRPTLMSLEHSLEWSNPQHRTFNDLQQHCISKLMCSVQMQSTPDGSSE